MPGVLRFPSEISVLRKEVFNNWYKLRTYYLATLMTSTPIHVRRRNKLFLNNLEVFNFITACLFRQTFFAAVYATIVYFITEQPPEQGRYLKFVLVYILVTLVADGFGILLGTLVNPIVRFHSNEWLCQCLDKVFSFRTEHFSVLCLHASWSCSPDFSFSLNTCQFSWPTLVTSVYTSIVLKR